jgi:hypothetical protein
VRKPSDDRSPCPFCDRTRPSTAALLDHLGFWHGLDPATSRRVLRNTRTIPVWVVPQMDERATKLRQMSF